MAKTDGTMERIKATIGLMRVGAKMTREYVGAFATELEFHDAAIVEFRSEDFDRHDATMAVLEKVFKGLYSQNGACAGHIELLEPEKRRDKLNPDRSYMVSRKLFVKPASFRRESLDLIRKVAEAEVRNAY